MNYPLTFQPVFMERVWGGRRLQSLYDKPLPDQAAIGESWEITDRPEAVSTVTNGPLAGKTLRGLMEEDPHALLGPVAPVQGRFPLLIKILDACRDLSVQVHPPAHVAARLGGEPKTEMWFMAQCEPGAKLYAGLRTGVTRDIFQQHLRDGTVADCLHLLPVQAGDALFLPSGRVHAIGAGNVLFEIQQNSDTTYRVFDWNRPGLDGQPRPLHIEASLASINFDDHEPGLIQSRYSQNPTLKIRYLVHDPLFNVDVCLAKRNLRFHLRSEGPQILGVLQGRLEVSGGQESVLLRPGQFVLLPAALDRATLVAQTRAEYLHILPGHGPVAGTT